MALSILDGTQTATTLSTILSSGQHITAHTVVSLGTQAITDMRGAVSGSVVSISNFPASQPISGTVSVRTDLDVNSNQPCVAVAFDSPGGVQRVGNTNGFPIRPMQDGSGNSIPLPISGTVTVGNSVTIGSALDALNDYAFNYNEAWPIKYANTHGGDPFPISGTVTANTFALQGTVVTTSNFTSTTASTVLASFNATREVLTIFNEGAGNLHICAGATCTTIAYQVRLSAGDYYEVPLNQTSLTHSAVFATAGTARVTQVS